MFTRAAAGSANTRGTPGKGKGVRFAPLAHAACAACPRHSASCPSSCLAEEIETPGDGQIRALITVAGNPVLSTPNAGRLAARSRARLHGERRHLRERDHAARRRDPARALGARPAPLRPRALPARGPQRRQLLARRSLELDDSQIPEWQTLLRLAGIAAGQGPDADVDAFDDFVIGSLVAATCRTRPRRSTGATPRSCSRRSRRAADPSGCSTSCCAPVRTATASATTRTGSRSTSSRPHPHGIDFGPLEPRIPDVLRTPSGKIELAPEPIVADVDRLRAAAARHRNGDIVLVGRRQLRSNNSWMHNVPNLVKGKARCTMHVHPDDAERLGLDGRRARDASRPSAGEVEIPVEVTDAIMPGVVSIPHGWGHDDPERAAGGRRGPPRHEQQPARRRDGRRRSLRQRRAERHPGRARAGARRRAGARLSPS